MCKTTFSPIKTTKNHLVTPLLTREQAIPLGRFGDGSPVTRNACILETQEPSPHTIKLFTRQPGGTGFTTDRFWKDKKGRHGT